MDTTDTDTHTDTAAAQALHEMAQEADAEARKLRAARNGEIRRLYEAGWSGTRLADELGMTPRAVYDIINASR